MNKGTKVSPGRKLTKVFGMRFTNPQEFENLKAIDENIGSKDFFEWTGPGNFELSKVGMVAYLPLNPEGVYEVVKGKANFKIKGQETIRHMVIIHDPKTGMEWWIRESKMSPVHNS